MPLSKIRHMGSCKNPMAALPILLQTLSFLLVIVLQGWPKRTFYYYWNYTRYRFCVLVIIFAREAANRTALV